MSFRTSFLAGPKPAANLAKTHKGMKGYLSLKGVTKQFAGTPAVDDLDLEIGKGETVVLLGPSGCGKTTCLRMIAGFERPERGEISLDGSTLVSGKRFVPAEKRNMAVVFQQYALWPHMNVDQNISFGPRVRGAARTEVAERVDRVLDVVGLSGLSERFPHELSGGQQQRVAMGRAIVTNPSLLLLDEPLSNLDTRLREEMRGELKRLKEDLNFTMVYVTHDQAEALSLADRLVVMKSGRIEQIGPPEEVYRHPTNGFVARALGATNLIDTEVFATSNTMATVRVVEGMVKDIDVDTLNRPISEGSRLTVSIRPSDISLSEPGTSPSEATVVETMFFGDSVRYEIKTTEGVHLAVLDRADRTPFIEGDKIAFDIGAHRIAALND